MRTTTARRPGDREVADVAIAADGVTKRYGGQAAVADLALDVPRGTIFGFVGPSGSGKTTTVRLLTGIHAPDEGVITVLGVRPSAFTPADRRRLGYLPQLSVLFPNLSIHGNLSFVASLYGMPLRRKARLREVLDFVELWDERGKRLRDASGGMQRRLALAAALVHEPELLFLDEPTAGIDPILRRKFWDRFDELRDAGVTLFVTTQYVSEAAYCDLVGVLDGGRLVAVDTPEGLRRRAFGGDTLAVRSTAPLDPATVAAVRGLPAIRHYEPGADAHSMRVVVDRADEAIPRIADWFDDRGTPLDLITEDTPAFDDVFVALLEEGER